MKSEKLKAGSIAGFIFLIKRTKKIFIFSFSLFIYLISCRNPSSLYRSC